MLPEPIFTPATKAALGEHDDNVSFEAVAETVGRPLAEKVRDLSITLYERAAAHSLGRGVIVADTKMEFGVLGDTVVLGDELVTPDSSRFWPTFGYRAGQVQPSFDKQYVRDWLTSDDSGWVRNSGNEPPPLPEWFPDVSAPTLLGGSSSVTCAHPSHAPAPATRSDTPLRTTRASAARSQNAGKQRQSPGPA